jgi:hypothetical protein
MIKSLIVLSFIYDFICAVLVSKGIGGYFVIADQQYPMINVKRFFLTLMMIVNVYMYLNYEKHNRKLEEATDQRITVTSVRLPQLAAMFAMASATWLVY